MILMILYILTLPSGQKRGMLRIYFGYAAGVGKTCAMLKGLETLSTLVISYKGVELREFDLDSALQRRPQLILVDEFAHTNAAGCRHKKRYQDVEELLEAGIDVYTTVNVQHIENLNDIVESLTVY